MNKNKNADTIFEEYADLYKLTAKTADEHIAFYKKKESLSMEYLFDVWHKLSLQALYFDDRLWIENWHNWAKNMQAFEGHKFEAKFLIQHYLTDVLDELVSRLITEYVKPALLKVKKSANKDEISELVKDEVTRQVKEALKKKKKT